VADIVLATINAKYIHASFGLRCLRANLGELRERSVLLEFNLGQRPLEIAERILAHSPRIVGLGVYIWNVRESTELAALLRRIRPELVLVLGGPEVSHEVADQEIVRWADHVVCGEGEVAFRELCTRVLGGGADKPARILQGGLPDLAGLADPYAEYDADDIANRLVYVEASRGCPFSCEFCLSSADLPVRSFPLEPFLVRMEALLARGLLHFKFVDRTFNLHLPTSRRILEFFLERLRPGLFLHFEMVPDRLPEALRELLARFPAGTLQLEVGIQTFDTDAATRISRRQDYARLEDNMRFLREHTRAHVHADLIAGLPGETEASFGEGFDRLLAMGPQEIQVGILKRLRGTPIGRHDATCGMIWSPCPPYEILSTAAVPFEGMQRLRRFARTWDMVGNSGNFSLTVKLLWEGAPAPFPVFMAFSEWYYAREGRHHAVALVRTMERVFEYLIQERGVDPVRVATALWEDYRRGGHAELPPFLRPHLPDARPARHSEPLRKGAGNGAAPATTKRQGRHG